MADNTIKSGNELVSEFLQSIANDSDVDATTLSCIHTLRDKGKLSKTQLLKSLQAARAGDKSNDEDKNA